LKKIFIIRHAKSDQRFFGNDFERPLNERGITDAPIMAGRLLDKNIMVEALISSPAIRARQTAEIFADILKMPASAIIFKSALYHAPADVFYEVLADLPNSLSNIAVFSHNPGITFFINSLDTKAKIDSMPTCGIYAFSAHTNQWSEFKNCKKEWLFFDYPKLIL
jgi:phosphohistidine phosphatase